MTRAAPMQKMRDDARMAEAMPAPVAPVVAAPVFATLDAGAYEATFAVPGPVDLPQDGTIRTFTLASKMIEPAIGARTVPILAGLGDQQGSGESPSKTKAVEKVFEAIRKLVDDKRGVQGWTYDYKPGEQRDVRLGWRIRWPADRDLRRQ